MSSVSPLSRGLPAVFMQSDSPAWESCRVIRPPLLQAYRRMWGENGFRSFFYSEDQCFEAVTLTGRGLLDLAKEVREANPSRLVFVDHAPCPAPLLMALNDVYGSQPLPPVYVHAYGDFPLRAHWWVACEDFLRKTSVTLICASSRQANFISRFLNEPGIAVEVAPFPVETEHYRFDPELRKQTRAKLGVGEQDFVLLYSGRISRQKNVELLMRRFELFVQRTGLSARLLICGKFDDLGSPLFGLNEAFGTMYDRFRESLTSRISYLGHLQPEELLAYYNAADCYVSLSLHHDEDFGMSPAEALCTGSPVVLTSWGGYGAFVSDHPQDCQLLPVRQFESCEGTFFRSLLKQALSPVDDSMRADRCRRYHDRLSVQAGALALTAIHRRSPSPFMGFSGAFYQLAERMRAPVVYPDAGSEGSLYSYLYEAYRGG